MKQARRRSVIQEANEAIQPGWFFRHVAVIYADRKIIVPALLYTVLTFLIFAHFGLKKANSQIEKVPPGASKYWWKVLVPCFEFGTMHVILFQLAILPLTMCHLTISKASSTFLNSVIPFNEMIKSHIVIGYFVICFCLITIALFLTFFGLLCSEGEKPFCNKMKSEIMITGYFIFVGFTTVGISAYLRNRIRYRIFYVIHHLVFIIYVVTIFHTFDNVQRDQGGRSQTFKWFSSTLSFYICDRAAMYMNHRYESVIVETIAVSSGINENKMVILKVKKPELFHFSPGQYLYLKIPEIDQRWHPFSVASAPSADTVDFYIEVFGEKSWSRRLWNLTETNYGDEPQNVQNVNNYAHRRNSLLFKKPDKRLRIEMMGPYGASLGKIEDYSHGLVIGAGTGVVPVLSLLQHHIQNLKNLDPEKFEENLLGHHSLINALHSERVADRTPVLPHCRSLNDRSYYSKIASARNHINAYVVLTMTPVLGTIILGLNVSWSFLPFDLYDDLKLFLAYGTVIFQFLYFVLTLTVQERHSLWTYIDLLFVFLSAIADSIWFTQERWGNFDFYEMMSLFILTTYMILRSWITAVRASYNPVSHANKRRKGFVILEKVTFIWVTRSSSLISKVYPDIVALWDSLCDAWGEEQARQVCEISVYCTDPDKESCAALADEFKDTELYRSNIIRFKRPMLQNILERHSMMLLTRLTTIASRTLIAFCGSEGFGAELKQAKILNDASLFVNCANQHEMDLTVECYGGLKSKKLRGDQMLGPGPTFVPAGNLCLDEKFETRNDTNVLENNEDVSVGKPPKRSRRVSITY